MKKILVTGGLGYIGSHTCVELLNSGYDVVVVDNLYNSKLSVKEKIEELGQRKISFYEFDLCDENALRKVFEKEKIDAVINFAGYKAVGESVEKPIKYYHNNLVSLLNLMQVMDEFNCHNLIFSSSATVYGDPEKLPIDELQPATFATNPYGYTKVMGEQFMKDYAHAKSANMIALRYFNPIGAHKSGLIGESPNGIPNNLMPYICDVASGKQPFLRVFGNDYDTKDGTGVRDYIHVVDLAKGHVKAVDKIFNSDHDLGFVAYNLGTGQGYSVLEMVDAFKRVNGIEIAYEVCPRRNGDVATCYANPSKALEELGWKTEYGLDDMIKDHWNFIAKNQ